MQNNIPKPRLLSEWLQLLDQTRLPIAADDKRRLLHALSNNHNSIGDIARVAGSSPSIALLFFRAANQGTARAERRAQHMEAVIARLGISRCKELLNSFEVSSEDEIPQELRQLWLISEHANFQASGLFAIKLARLWQDINWSSLLFLSPLWPLLTRYPSLFRLWEQRLHNAGESQLKLELELFGTSLNNLCLALAEHWALPDLVIEAYNSINRRQRLLASALHVSRAHAEPLKRRQMLDARKDLTMWFRHPANSIIIAHGLSINAHYSWYHPHFRRWQEFASLLLGWPLAQVQSTTHQSAVSHAHNTGRSLLWHPACALPWPPQARQTRPLPADEKPESVCVPQLWQQQARLLLQRPSPFANHAQLLAALGKLLNHAGLGRCALININHQTGKLQPVFQSGFAFVLHQPLSQDANALLVQQLLRNSRPVLVRPQNLGRLKELLTQDFSAAITSSNFLVGTIRLKHKPVMLLVADNHDRPLGIAETKAFDASSRYFEQALDIIATRQA